jgi:hypothetical protein
LSSTLAFSLIGNFVVTFLKSLQKKIVEWTLRTVRGTLLPNEETFFPFEILSVLGKLTYRGRLYPVLK